MRDHISQIIKDNGPDVYGLIYFVLNTIDGKYYVGQTVRSLKVRWPEHIYKAKYSKKNSSINFYFYNALNYYGYKNFEVRTLFTCSNQEDLDSAEIFFISLFDSSNQKVGYNSSKGGCGGKKTEATKAKISSSRVGIKQTPESRKNISEATKGIPKPRTPEHQANLTASLTGKKRSPEACANIGRGQKGKKCSPEHCAKISIALSLRVCSDETRKRLSEANKGRKHTSEAKANMSAAHKGKAPIQTPESIEKSAKNRIGQKRTPEQRANMRAGQAARRARLAEEDLLQENSDS